MRKYKIIALVAFIAACLMVPVTQALAGTMEFRMVFFHTKSEIFPVGDVPDHIVAAGESTGLATLTTGEVAVATITSFADYTQGRGPHWGYTRLTFEDGSTIDFKIEGSTRPDPKGKGSLFEATDFILRGSGRPQKAMSGGDRCRDRISQSFRCCAETDRGGRGKSPCPRS